MRNKVYWGLGVLIVLFIGVFVLVMVNEYAENDQLEADAKKAQEQADRNKQQKHVKDNPLTDDPVLISEPIEPPPVEEKPRVSEVSNGTGKHSEPMTDEWLRKFYLGGRFSPEQLERIKELHTEEIELLESSVASYEASIEKNSEFLHRHPNSEFFRKMYEQDTLHLNNKSRRLNELKRVMEEVYDVK